MSRILDKFTYTSSYRQDFCPGTWVPRSVKKPENPEECKPKYVPRFSTGLPPNQAALGKCPCQPGGSMPPRGAKIKGLPTNLDIKCPCFTGGTCRPPPPIKRDNLLPIQLKPVVRKEKKPPKMIQYSKSSAEPEVAVVQPICSELRRLRPVARGKFGSPHAAPPWMQQRRDERRDPDVLRLRRHPQRGEVTDVVQGEEARAARRFSDTSQTERPRRMSSRKSNVRIPGPFWIRERQDERKEVDVLRKKRIPSVSEMKDVVHGEGRRMSDTRINRFPCRKQSSSRIPEPFWANKRCDERREVDVLRKKKIPQRNELPDLIHGEAAMARELQESRPRRIQNIYDLPPGPSHADPFWMLERQDERRDPDMDQKRKFRRKKLESAEIIHGEDFRTRWDPSEDADGDDSDGDDSEPFPFTRACRCGPPPPQSGPDKWIKERDWGQAGPSSLPPKLDVPQDVEETIRNIPAARVSCAPEAPVANFDQPTAFMRKLYQKYPYLYQVLAETPPEQLMSRVFKDRFLSTYQVDYLHMGIGANERPPEGVVTQAHTGPDGEREPGEIPGCSYRSSQKAEFGRKKQEQPEKKEKEDREVQPAEEKDPGIVSEYMATISKLGGEIVQDQLYATAEIVKKTAKKT